MEAQTTESSSLIHNHTTVTVTTGVEDDQGYGTTTNDQKSRIGVSTKKKCIIISAIVVILVLIVATIIFSAATHGGSHSTNNVERVKSDIRDKTPIDMESILESKPEAKSKKITDNDVVAETETETETEAKTTTTPNIIFILMDDMGFSDFSARGSEFTTPNLDSLYEESIVIDQHYIGLVCSPSRSQIITGRYAWNMGLSEMTAFSSFQINSIPRAIPTLGDLLGEYSDYKAYFVGKWHMGFSTYEHCPLNRGFDYFHGFYTSNIAYSDKTITFPDGTSYIDWRDGDDVDYDTQYEYSTYVTGDKLLGIINTHLSNDNTKNKPFYVHVPFQGFHASVEEVSSDNDNNCDVITKAYDISHTSEDGTMSINKLYNDIDIFTRDKLEEELLASLNDDEKEEVILKIDERSGLAILSDGDDISPDDTEDDTDYTDGDYYTNRVKMCQNILAFDQVLGDLLDNLKNTNDIWDNTMIIFTSDNGGSYNFGACNYPLRGVKESFFEGGVRTSAFIAGGYVEKYIDNELEDDNDDDSDDSSSSSTSKQLTRSDGFMHGVDWTPTILGFAGVDVSKVESKLSKNLYTSVAKKASLIQHHTETFFKNYLMETSFDGNDLSKWILNGDNSVNPRTDHIPLSINAIKSNSATNGESPGTPDYTSAIIFKSDTTQHYYKLMYLNGELKHSSKKAHWCTYRTVSSSSSSGDVSDNDDTTEEYLQRTQTVGDFVTTNAFLFDLTIDYSESTNLLEVLSNDNNNNDDKPRVDSDTTYDNLDDYTSSVVSSIWKEGIETIKTEYIESSPMFNDYLSCIYTNFDDDADPSQFNNAFTPFYSWDKYLIKFDEVCASSVNPVLSVMYKSKYQDYST